MTFNDEIAAATPGAAIVYHTGVAVGTEAPDVALAARAAYAAGLVELVQSRRGDSEFAYVAIVRRHKRPPVLNGAWLEEAGSNAGTISAKQAELTEP
jgi:hypothetical protein